MTTATTHLQQDTRTALGCEVTLTVVSSDPTTAMLATLWRHIEAFEHRLSRFRPTSEINQFNARAGEKVTVSPQFMAVLRASAEAMKATNGVFNIFTLPDLERAGYTTSWVDPSRISSESLLKSSALPEALELGESWARIPQGTAIDFGGIGKGFLLDELAGLMRGRASGFWFSLGGDVFASGIDPAGQPWRITIDDARDPNRELIEVTASQSGQAVATSGITKRRGIGPAGPWHHLIDPATGKPASTSVLTASVVATSGLWADIWARVHVITDEPRTANHEITATERRTGVTALAIQRLGQPTLIVGQGLTEISS